MSMNFLPFPNYMFSVNEYILTVCKSYTVVGVLNSFDYKAQLR